MAEFQRSLFDRGGTIQQRFELFHAKHPEVYAELVRLARSWRKAGKIRCSVGALWEVMRWGFEMARSGDDDDFKLNDHFRSRYVRLMCVLEPDLASMFELRALRSE